MSPHPGLLRLLRAVVAASVVVCLPAAAQAGPYTFVTIADDTGAFSGFDIGPSINSSGTIAFRAFFAAGGRGIFSGSGGALTTIADSNGPVFSTFFGNPSINSSGTVAFRGGFDAGGAGVFTGSGGPTTTIADSNGPVFSSFAGDPSINSAGTVAVEALFDLGGEGIITGNGGPTAILYDTNDAPFFNVSDPSINDAGTVAFRAQLDAGGTAIVSGNGGPITTIADGNGPTFSGFSSELSIDTAGTVAFQAILDAGGRGIFTGNGGPTTTIADTNDFDQLDNYVAINNVGTVAFVGYYGSDHGIFTGPNLLTDKVIATGDSLAGSTVSFVFIFEQALNDSGQLAFYAELEDGRSGIFRADPVSAAVPEPASLTLLVLGSLGLSGYDWRRRRRTAHSVPQPT